MRAGLRWARRVRVSRRQFWLGAAVSAGVTALLLSTALGHPNWEAAALAALRDQPVAPASGGSGPGGASLGSLAASLPSGSVGALPSGGSLPSASPSAPASSARPPSSAPSNGATGKKPVSTGHGSGSGKTGNSKPKSRSPIKHIYLISLATGSYADAFGAGSTATYLRALRPKGELLAGYQSVSGVPLADDLALIGGQPTNPDTLANCPSYDDFPVGHAPNRHGVMSGAGCVYPDTVLTLGDQLDGADLKWRGFVDGMTAPCVHPNSSAAVGADSAGYDPRENPFVFFHSLLDLGDCQEYDLPLTGLARATAAKPHAAPSFVYIAADPCDGGASGCTTSSTPTGTTTSTTTSTTTGSGSTSTDPTVTAGDAFLSKVVPEILKSKAYRKAGALLILFSGTSGAQAGQPTGGLILSPFVRAGSTYRQTTNAYGALRTIDEVFGLTPLTLASHAKPIKLIKP